MWELCGEGVEEIGLTQPWEVSKVRCGGNNIVVMGGTLGWHELHAMGWLPLFYFYLKLEGF